MEVGRPCLGQWSGRERCQENQVMFSGSAPQHPREAGKLRKKEILAWCFKKRLFDYVLCFSVSFYLGA